MLLSVEITPEMKAQLDAVKTHYGLSVSDVVRIMLKKQLQDKTPFFVAIEPMDDGGITYTPMEG
jgi:antitoxin component of RelBE/YafQ-DinJ toxin-antitoxin module